MKSLLSLGVALLLLSGCAGKQYFEPEDSESFSGDTSSIGSSIESFNRDGATLDSAQVISKNGLSSVELKEGYHFLNNSEQGLISSNNKDSVMIGNEVVNLGTIVVAASLKDGILAMVNYDNSVSAYDLQTKKVIFKKYLSKSLVNDIRLANPYFMSNILLFPTLDGKVLVVSLKNFKILRTINVDASGKFNNITFLDVVNDTLIAATSNKIVSVGDGVLNVKSYSIRDVIAHDKNIYLATIDGQIIKTDISLNVQNRKKYTFAKFYALAFGESLYALESQGYLINISEDFTKETIYDFSFDEDDKVIALGDTLYLDDEYIKLK